MSVISDSKTKNLRLPASWEVRGDVLYATARVGASVVYVPLWRLRKRSGGILEAYRYSG